MFHFKPRVWSPADRCTSDKRFCILPYWVHGCQTVSGTLDICCLRMLFYATKQNVRIYKQMISGVVCLLNCFCKHNLKLMGQPLSKENMYSSMPCCCDNVFNVEHIQIHNSTEYSKVVITNQHFFRTMSD